MFVGEVGLGGEVRPVSQVDRRLAEAAQLGFKTAYFATRCLPRRAPDGLKVIGVESLRALFERLFG